jgi:hypothetical protein
MGTNRERSRDNCLFNQDICGSYFIAFMSGDERLSRPGHCSAFSAGLAETPLYTLLDPGNGCVSQLFLAETIEEYKTGD